VTDEQDRYLKLAKEILELKGQIREFQAEVVTLKVFLINQIMPDQLESTLRSLEAIQAEVLKSDPLLSSQRQASDVIDALRHLKKRGSSEPDS